MYQKTCTRKENQEIEGLINNNGLQRIYLIGGDEGDLPEGDFTSLTLYVKSPARDFNHAFSHEDKSEKDIGS